MCSDRRCGHGARVDDHRQGPQRATPYSFCGDGADGQMLWNPLIRKHPNTRIVISGSVEPVPFPAAAIQAGKVVKPVKSGREKSNQAKKRVGGLQFLLSRFRIYIKPC